MKPLVENLKRSRAFTFSAYISYLYGYADQLLVTVFLSPELIGSFSIGKRLFEFAKQFVENIFDPQLQKLVSYKNNLAQLSISFDKIWKLRNIILSIGVLMTPLIFVIIDPVIIIIGLEQYSNLNYLLVVIFISQVLHVAMKVKSNFISIFYHQKYFFIITVVTAITSIISLLILLSLFNFKYIFMYVVITNFVMTIYTSKVFNKNNGILYRTFK